MQVDLRGGPLGRLHIFNKIFYFQYSHQDDNRGETYEVSVSHLLIKQGNIFICIARSEWLNSSILTEITLRPDRSKD